MPKTRLRRVEQAKPPPPQADRGPDGKTFGERLQACMEVKSRKLGRKYTQADLIRDMNRLAGRTGSGPDIISQQAISLILNNLRSESGVTPIMAAALEVEGMWLGFGIGPRDYLDSALKKSG